MNASDKEMKIRTLVKADAKVPNALLLAFLDETHSIRLQAAWYKRNYERLKEALETLKKAVESARADATHLEPPPSSVTTV